VNSMQSNSKFPRNGNDVILFEFITGCAHLTSVNSAAHYMAKVGMELTKVRTLPPGQYSQTSHN
jgi:hypothetical protein